MLAMDFNDVKQLLYNERAVVRMAQMEESQNRHNARRVMGTWKAQPGNKMYGNVEANGRIYTNVKWMGANMPYDSMPVLFRYSSTLKHAYEA